MSNFPPPEGRGNFAETILQKSYLFFRDKFNFSRILGSYAPQLQELEDLFITLWLMLDINNAEGEFLDFFGKIVGVQRAGRDDDAYRIAILTEIKFLRSRAVTSDIYSILNTTDDADYHVKTLLPSADFEIYSDKTLNESSLTELLKSITKNTPAGVNFDYIYSESADTELRFSSNPTEEEDDPAHGKGDTAETYGGLAVNITR